RLRDELWLCRSGSTTARVFMRERKHAGFTRSCPPMAGGAVADGHSYGISPQGLVLVGQESRTREIKVEYTASCAFPGHIARPLAKARLAAECSHIIGKLEICSAGSRGMERRPVTSFTLSGSLGAPFIHPLVSAPVRMPHVNFSASVSPDFYIRSLYLS
ncbi:MAG: hypothetical protein K2F79_07335, partial [Muribaculaceae bacterium]|nr:hypothetical protein [Muribaculaceae bacterium]